MSSLSDKCASDRRKDVCEEAAQDQHVSFSSGMNKAASITFANRRNPTCPISSSTVLSSGSKGNSKMAKFMSANKVDACLHPVETMTLSDIVLHFNRKQQLFADFPLMASSVWEVLLARVNSPRPRSQLVLELFDRTSNDPATGSTVFGESLRHNPPFHVVDCLLELSRHDPAGRNVCAISDIQGWLPLHCAVWGCYDEKVFQLLYSQYPVGLGLTDVLHSSIYEIAVVHNRIIKSNSYVSMLEEAIAEFELVASKVRVRESTDSLQMLILKANRMAPDSFRKKELLKVIEKAWVEHETEENRFAVKLCVNALKKQGAPRDSAGGAHGTPTNELREELFVFFVLEEMISRGMYGLAELVVAYAGGRRDKSGLLQKRNGKGWDYR